MRTTLSDHGLKVFATCTPSALSQQRAYLDEVRQIARWSEDAGCEGILVYTDNRLLDPWLLSQVIIESTAHLCPLVAVQPVYLHPYSVAKIVASIAFLYGRRVYLNMVAGGFKNDLEALNDPTPHDERYARLVEYTTVIQRLLGTTDAVTFDGRYYRTVNLKLTPPLPRGLTPGVLLSGSSAVGVEAARQLGATVVEYPKPVAEYGATLPSRVESSGIRIGIVARPRGGDAWSVALERFPEDRKGQLAHQLAMKVSDSSWHKQLSELGATRPGEDNPYWLLPFENYKTFCPYLVGSYDRVAEEIARYLDVGYRTFILDVPASPEELGHIGAVFERAALSMAA